MTFVEAVVNYCKENPLLTAILIALAVFIAIIIAIIVVLSNKAKKAQAVLANKANTPDVTTATKQLEEQSEKQEEPSATAAQKSEPQKNIEKTEEENKSVRYAGKWVICRLLTDEEDTEESYFFELHASNGEKLLSSEEYTTFEGARKGIETHKTNILNNNFRITLSKKGDYIFKLLSGKNSLLCTGENYSTRARCENAVESTKRFAKTAVIDENVQDHIVKVPQEDNNTVLPLPDGYNGKWVISACGEENEKYYYFELFANNGEKLLSSEEYTTYTGAINGIQTHIANINQGNFRITLTKRGDYIYKLLNGNGQLLCLGEHYKTKRLCQNAVESVKRFASSPVLTDPELKK